MPKPFITSASVPLLESPALQENLDAAKTYCSHACQAAKQGRFRAAHGLFQTAILFFERARIVAAPDDEGTIRGAFDQLDEGAWWVYPPNPCGPQASLRGVSK